MDCIVCGQGMEPSLTPEVSHPACSEASFFSPLDNVDPFSAALKQQLLEMILSATREDPRSKQREIGPSEVGNPCDRRLAYRLAEVPEVNVAFDPWPATVGTAIHAWLEKAIGVVGDHTWLTETTIDFPEFGGKGHGDLYHDGVVIDWKTGSKEVMRKVRNDGPPASYVTQVQLYGFGFTNAGHPVKKVALVFLPRAGWLKDMYVWSADYDQQVALDAIQRMYRVAQQAVTLQVTSNPHRWEQVPATPSDGCGMCPWYNALRTYEDGASDQGCPGH